MRNEQHREIFLLLDIQKEIDDLGLIGNIQTGDRFIQDQKLRIDDPVGAISVHGICGALGTVLTGLFATGGTTKAMIELIEELGGKVIGVVVLMELAGLKGRDKLGDVALKSAIVYPGK